jgi:hypothetical protein
MKTTIIEEIIGRTIDRIEGGVNEDKLVFHFNDGDRILFEHYQDCCESVEMIDIVGELDDLTGTPLLKAEERTVEATEENAEGHYVSDEAQWTFYEFATIKGSVTVRWFGSSNGYYSVSVDRRIFKAKEKG